jgi:hypothetical protein
MPARRSNSLGSRGWSASRRLLKDWTACHLETTIVSTYVGRMHAGLDEPNLFVLTLTPKSTGKSIEPAQYQLP